MANFDTYNDTTPQNTLKPPRLPKVSALRTALLAVNSGASYTADRLNAMTKNDMISAARAHSLTVAGL